MNKKTIVLLAAGLLAAPLFAANDRSYTYLALGDSIPFGMDITKLPPYASQLPTPTEFVGYPEVIAQTQHVTLLNPSCPGESSGSFLNVNSPDYGCNFPHPQPDGSTVPPFKALNLLRVNYSGSQMDFALDQVKHNKNINLVTLNIGANDVFLVLPALLECRTDQTCAGNVLGPVLNKYASNLEEILTGIRKHYQGQLVVMTYYSPAPELDGVAVAVNNTMTAVVNQLNAQKHFADVLLVDAFIPFQVLSAGANHDACQAGLLIRLPATPPPPQPCDIHPSEYGRNVLAATVTLALLTNSTN
jgi:lysophospholipase L1-like esterase